MLDNDDRKYLVKLVSCTTSTLFFLVAMKMDEQFYKPIWVKVALAFALVMSGIVLTWMMFRFFPMTNEVGAKGYGVLKYVCIGLGVTLVLYIVGVSFMRNYPYRIFLLCLMLFFGILVFVRYMVIGY